MWGKSTFDNEGGFMDASISEEGGGGDKKDQVRRNQNVVPVVVRMIQDSQEEDFKMWGMPVQIVCIVGLLRNFDIQSTKASCTLEDHTGSIQAVLWLEEDDPNKSPNIPQTKEGNYVKVFGSIRNQGGSKMIMILKMFPVDDLNLVTNHLLEVIHVRLSAEAASKRQKQPNLNVPGAALASSMSSMDVYDMPQSSGNTRLTHLQEKVFQLLKDSHELMAGLSRSAILSKFPKHQEREINQALELFVTEGHAYSTIDNDHFKATDTV